MNRRLELLSVFAGSWFMVGGALAPSISGLLTPVNALTAVIGAAALTTAYYGFLRHRERD